MVLTYCEKKSKAFCRLFCYWISRRRGGHRTNGVEGQIKYDMRFLLFNSLYVALKFGLQILVSKEKNLFFKYIKSKALYFFKVTVHSGTGKSYFKIRLS